MSLYEKIRKTSEDKDIKGYLDLLHDDFVFVRHQTGNEVTKSEWEPTLTAMMESESLETTDVRCLYENNEILVMHQMMNFPDGTSEAVMIVNNLKDGKIIRAETGATPIKNWVFFNTQLFSKKS